MTGATTTQRRVRPGIRRAAIASVFLLAPIAVHSLWDYVEARRLSSAVEAIRQRGERVHFGNYREGRPSTPDERQASRYYGAAGLLVRDAYGKPFEAARQTIAAMSALQPAAARQDSRLDSLRQLAEQYVPALDLIDRAARLDARGLDYADESRYGFPNKSLADVNALRVARLAFLGEADAASRALVSTLRIRRAYADYYWSNWLPDSLDSLGLVLAFSPPADSELLALQNEFARWDVDTEVEDQLIGMRARLIQEVWPGAFGELASLPRVRDPQDRGRVPRLIDLVMRPWVTRRVTRMLQEFEEALGTARQPWPTKLDAAKDFADRHPESKSTRPATSGPTFLPSLTAQSMLDSSPMASELGRLAPAVATKLARRRVALATLAVERYRRAHSGLAPASLEELVPAFLKSVPQDPFSGQPLRYSIVSNSYRVYSLGENRKDDGGDWTEIEMDRTAPYLVRKASSDLGLDVPLRQR